MRHGSAGPMPGSSRSAADEVPCLVHADAHVGNLYRTPDDRIGIIDWQLVQGNWWGLDVAYHVAAALDHARSAAGRA